MRSVAGNLVLIVATFVAVWPGRPVGAAAASGFVPSPDKDYVAIFSKDGGPIAVVEKPKGVPIGPGTAVEIDAFGLRIAADDRAILPFLRRQPEWVGDERAKLPSGFVIYANPNVVRVHVAASTQKCRLQFIDPVDLVGPGGGSKGGGGR
jgi:hypothetical protein